METVRRQGRRLAWLMAGAAIGLAVVLLVVVVVTMAAGQGAMLTGPPWLVVAAASLLLAALLGLVPGVRELEVTGARSMLGADGDLLVPHRPRPAHQLQTSAWVTLHLTAGLLVAGLLATFVPSAVLYLVELAAGRPLGSGVPLPGSAPGRAGAAGAALLVGVISLLAWWPLGALLARLAPHLLGPTTADRLELAQQRADREAERTRIARELHDGIGHALTVVSVQAAAARAVQARDPEAVRAALAAIEDTARGATAELDAVLALLREEPGTAQMRRSAATGDAATGDADRGDAATGAAERGDPDPRTSAGGLPAQLEQVLLEHRRAGTDLRARLDPPAGVAELQRRHLVRCLAELLTNARRHGGPGPVEVTLFGRDRRIILDVSNPLRGTRNGDPPAAAPPSAPLSDPDAAAAPGAVPDPAVTAAPVGGRGLRGLRERAALLGGTIEAGPCGGRWVARLDLPLLMEDDAR